MNIFIYAGSYDQFHVAKLSLPPNNRYIYLSQPDQLHGLSKIVVYLYGTYYENHSHNIIMLTLEQKYAEIREMPMTPNGDG